MISYNYSVFRVVVEERWNSSKKMSFGAGGI
jgi:hypothetical protein